MIHDRPTALEVRAPSSAEGEPLHVEFAGQWVKVQRGDTLGIGRDADLSIEDNPYLHRRLLELHWDRYWWISNVGNQLSATVSDDSGAMSAWLAPGSTLPLLCRATEVRFTAGPTGYQLNLLVENAPLDLSPGSHTRDHDGTTTLQAASLTELQHLTVLALAAPRLRSGGGAPASVPTSQEAANALGWKLTRFNRQLDATCQKLARAGVQGLHGDLGQLAHGRRARLVEYCLALRMVTIDDLPLLEASRS